MMGRPDPDLEGFLKDTDLLEVARLLASYTPPEPPLDPAFQTQLRRDLLRAAWDGQDRKMPWYRRVVGPRLAWAGATAGMAMIAIAAVVLTMTNGAGTPMVIFQLDRSQQVAVVEPIPVAFNQPMDHSSVERSLQIQPATEVTYAWSGNTLLVQPKAGTLAPNTQYKVTLAPTAKTVTGTPLPAAKTFIFVTKPLPSPTPGAQPSPSPTPAVNAPVQVATTGDGTVIGWSPDASTLFFLGADHRLVAVSTAAGTITKLADSAILAAPTRDGTQVAFANASGIWVVGADGHGRVQVATGETPSAIAWQHGKVLYVQHQSVLAATPPAAAASPGPARPSPVPVLVKLSAAPSAAAFNPAGDRLLYRAADGSMHLLDLSSGEDTQWSQSPAGLPVWSPAGTRVAYAGAAAVSTAAPDGHAAADVATLTDLGSPAPAQIQLDWSASDTLVAGTGKAVYAVDPYSKGARLLETTDLGRVTWTPDGDAITYVQAGSVWTAAIAAGSGEVQQDLLSQAARTLDAFMQARVAGQEAAAAAFLDSQAAAAYSAGPPGPSLLPRTAGIKLTRYFVVSAQVVAKQPATVRMMVRIVESQGAVEVVHFDETLLLRRGQAGHFLVHDVARSTDRGAGAGPEVLAVEVTPTKVQVAFDSDLQAATVAAALVIHDASGAAVPATVTYAGRTATITLSGRLQPGAAYGLAVLPALTDVGGQALAAEFDLKLTGPFPDEPAVTPSPSPSPAGSPSVQPSATPS